MSGRSHSDTFQGKVAVVTGGGSGLGRELCLELARRGALTVVTDINLENAVRVSEAIIAGGGRGYALPLDVSQEDQVSGVIAKVVADHGVLDYVFNNAGITTVAEVRDMSLEHWRKLIGVNFLGVLYGTLSAYAQMVKQGSGHIVNISSIGGLVTMPTYTAYSTTKHAVVALSNSLRAEARGLGVNVSVVCPGLMKTDLGTAATIVNAKKEEVKKRAEFGISPSVGARLILSGVERNKAMIVFPWGARLLWWAYRLWPSLLAPFESRMVEVHRTLRCDD